jgi:ABC-type transporter Mla subunit MlaD
MATTGPTTRDLDAVKKDIATESKRVDGLIDKLNEVFQHAKQNDDRIEKKVDAMAGKVNDTKNSDRIDKLVDRLNEVFQHAKQNDDRIENLVKALETKLRAADARLDELAKDAAKKK